MGDVDLNFKSSVPAFDANMSLGRVHDRRVTADTVEETLAEMDRLGVDRAVVYSPLSAAFSSHDGNRRLAEMTRNEPRLVPQFVCNPSYHDLEEFRDLMAASDVRSVRMLPMHHKYRFHHWAVAEWMEWLAEDEVPVWLPVEYESHGQREPIDPSVVFDTVERNPAVEVVISEVKYDDYSWIIPLLKSLPNLYVEISRYIQTDGVARLIDAVGERRVMFGSRFPESALGPQLYNLHHCGLSDEALRAICAGNLERILKL